MAERRDGYKQLGDSSVLVVNACTASLLPVETSSKIPLQRVYCDGKCRAPEAGPKQRLFAVPLNAPEGNVSDLFIARFLGANCAMQPPPRPSEAVPPLPPVRHS